VTDEQRKEQDDAIEGHAPGGSFRIPVDKKDIGPEIKWIIRAGAISMIILATGCAVAIVWSMAK
jgi:hypothetical protein